jgi:hypothetical protein
VLTTRCDRETGCRLFPSAKNQLLAGRKDIKGFGVGKNFEVAPDTMSAYYFAHYEVGTFIHGFLLDNLQHRPFFDLGGSCAQNRTNGSSRSSLLSDNLSEVILGHLKLKDRRLCAFHFINLNNLGMVHQRLSDVLDQILHSPDLLTALKEKSDAEKGMLV